ncbi:MAG: hypothetical protein HYS12_11230 [Planctomycetes bacterium]|nr:hypothetical protein [Planctomycetota bacterium]
MKTTLAELGNHVVFAQDDGFIGSFWFFALMIVILLVLCGVFYYLRSKQSDD